MNESHYLPPNLADTTSTRLLRGAAAGDAAAWRKLVDAYGPVVRYWGRRAGLNKADLADVFQETFLAVSKSLPKFERQDGQAKFRAWLKTVTLSKVSNHYERKGKQPAAFGGTTAMAQMGDVAAAFDVEESGEEDAALAHSEATFLVQRTLQVIRQEFRENTWQAFYRTAIEGRTSSQAAEELGMTALAVRKAKSRVMQRLKDALGGPGTS